MFLLNGVISTGRVLKVCDFQAIYRYILEAIGGEYIRWKTNRKLHIWAFSWYQYH